MSKFWTRVPGTHGPARLGKVWEDRTMSSSAPPPRPRSVTLGCIYGGLGGVLATVTLFQTLQTWGSLEMQEAVESGLQQLGASADVETLLPTLRWIAMGLLVAAIAATVFSFHAARGHQASRIGLTVLAAMAGLTFAMSGVAGLLPAIMAGLIIYLLWSASARQWYAVVNGKTPLSLGTSPSVTAGGPANRDLPAPPPYDPAMHPDHPPSQLTQSTPQRAGRPRPVWLALLIAGLGSAVGFLGSGLTLLVLVVLRDEMIDQYSSNELLKNQLESAGLTADQMVTVGTWLFSGWVVVSLLGLVATAWAATGRMAGWWALLAVSVLTAGLAAPALPIGLVWILGAIIVIVQLSRPETKAWFRRA